MDEKRGVMEFDIDGEILKTERHTGDSCTVFGCKTGKCGCINNIGDVYEQLMLSSIQDEFALANDNERLLRVISRMKEQIKTLETFRK